LPQVRLRQPYWSPGRRVLLETPVPLKSTPFVVLR
jgi:hypothetical protein